MKPIFVVKRVAEEKIDEGEKKRPRLEEEHVQRGKERLAAKLDGRTQASVIPEQIKYLPKFIFCRSDQNVMSRLVALFETKTKSPNRFLDGGAFHFQTVVPFRSHSIGQDRCYESQASGEKEVDDQRR